MEKYTRGDRAYSHTAENSPNKVRKVEFQQQAQESIVMPEMSMSDVAKNSATTFNDKMSNLKKLRQQFVDEVKNVEATLKENIKSLKLKIVEIDKEAETYNEKLKKINKHLCNQSELIYRKEQENKVLKEHVEELYEYQKIIFENLTDITNTQSTSDDLANQLKNQYDSIIKKQETNLKTLEEEFQNLTPDKNLCEELKKLDLNIAELDQEADYYEKKIQKVEMELKTKKQFKEEQIVKINEIDDKIKEIEIQNETSKQSANKAKLTLIEEIDLLKQQTSSKDAEIKDLDQKMSEVQKKLEFGRINKQETENKIKEVNNEKELLFAESKDLDEILKKRDEESQLSLEKIRDKLKVTKVELETEKQKQEQIIRLLKNKISDFKTKLSTYETLEPKLKRYESDLIKEKELSNQIIEESETKKINYNSKIKIITEKISKIKLVVNQKEQQFSESEKKVKQLEKELIQATEEYETKTKIVKSQSEKSISLVKNLSQFSFPKLFSSDQTEDTEKQKHVRKLYTVTLSEDDDDIDDLPFEEQYTQLTKSSPSETSEKARKFFKRSVSQSRSMKENTPRGKVRGKK